MTTSAPVVGDICLRCDVGKRNAVLKLKILATVLAKFYSALYSASQQKFSQNVQIFLPNIYGLEKNLPATHEII